jgi:DNA-directed RNA polymerase subunit beta'
MLEVNDFNAIRISLASPEQIRSWSYGEVTKPETINYRTLKPERDGLFCERIFGPTKDWECYCGKYKRIRYKGIVCDKCGVEIARSKVRRERMGHVELATPVSHIWFVKGTPSRIGLLLDLSPRLLERVLYFTQYIITNIDEDARQRALQAIDHENAEKIEKINQATKERVAEVERRLKEDIADLEKKKKAKLKDLEAKRVANVETIVEAAQAMESKLANLEGQVAMEPLTFLSEDMVIVKRREVIGKKQITTLRQIAQKKIEEAEAAFQERAEVWRAPFAAEEERLRRVAGEEIGDLRRKLAEESGEVQRIGEEKRDELLALEQLQLLSDSRYRELTEKCGRVFKAGMGAEAIHNIVSRIDLDAMRAQMRAESHSSSAQRRKKAVKRLRVVESFRKSGNRPEWMIFTVLPVIPPDLRPMVQLDGGRFATSDLNDLYRRVINRNNRLKRLIELRAPEIIVRNEKRMLQEAVDSLIDNGRRGRAVSTAAKHQLKSLSDMLRGKHGRFRQNLLGKRVDYSGRSVIVVGPELKLNQCGLPKRMALELFKPFVMHKLVERNHAHNIKSAKRIVERMKPEVWDVLEEVVRDHPVLLNRAPTLHRLGIQAFEAVLIDSSAIQIHPLVCTAYNADFDGDQMAVHVPLSAASQQEAKELMLSTHNLLSPSSGEPIVAPTKDMVLGCYYLTMQRPGAKGEGKAFASADEALLAYHMGVVSLQALVKARFDGQILDTTVGRIIFNENLPPQMRFKNKIQDKRSLRDVVAECYRLFGMEKTADLVDKIKKLGFRYATQSGTTIAIGDITIPPDKGNILAAADKKLEEMERQYRRGLITEEEKYVSSVELWTKAKEDVTAAVTKALDPFGSIHTMAVSGSTKGKFEMISQIAGMRGLMTDPSGRVIDLPIRSNFREGLSVLEYFISTHGARKGLADTALRTADSGYLTRRLVDVAQNVIVRAEDCGTTAGVWIERDDERGIGETMAERIQWRIPTSPVIDQATGEVIVAAGEEINEARLEAIERAGIKKVHIRSPLTCETHYGVCRRCYGRDLARGKLVEMGTAVGIIAAQSIGEPGTQLTMRTFHTGGVAGTEDITQGLPRVEELFEARVPKGQAIISDIDGLVEISREDDLRKVKVIATEVYEDEYPLPAGFLLRVADGDSVTQNQVLAAQEAPAKKSKSRKQESKELLDMSTAVKSRTAGHAYVADDKIIVRYEEREVGDYTIPPGARLKVEHGQRLSAGDQITEGTKNLQDILRIQGREAVQQYLLEEIQRVYHSQGVNINDRHIETIIRQMMRKVRVETPGDTQMLPGELIDRFVYEEANAKVLAEGGEPATAEPVLLGVTKASLNTNSFLAAASFQETTRVLTEAAISGSTDHLMGLKENVIIGKLIPAGTGFKASQERAQRALERPRPERALEPAAR